MEVKLKNYIKLYENILDKEVCKNIIKDTNFSLFERSKVNAGETTVVAIDERNVHRQPLNLKYEKIIFKTIGTILKKYGEEFNNFFSGAHCNDTGYEHLLYKGSEKGMYKTHTDSFSQTPRLISISILLNNNFVGGNFCFFDEYIIEKKIGSAVVFPSNFCFPHAVLPVTKGDRHSIITWIR